MSTIFPDWYNYFYDGCWWCNSEKCYGKCWQSKLEADRDKICLVCNLDNCDGECFEQVRNY